MKGFKLDYSASELRWIKRHCTLPRREAHAPFVEQFHRPDVSFHNFKSLCTRKVWRTGRDGRIQPGHIPWNTGKTRPYNANSARTQFQKGHQPHNTKALGYERIDKTDGYIYMCVEEPNPYTGFPRRFVLKHKYLWEQQHGPIPPGMCLKCLDGDRTHTDPANWELIPRAVNALLNGRAALHYDEVPAEARPALLTLAKLKYTVRRVSGKRQKKEGEVPA